MTDIQEDPTDLAHQYVKAAEALCREQKLFLGTGNALDVLDRIVATAIIAAEQRGEERERARCAKVAEQSFTIDTVNKTAKGKPYLTGEAAICAGRRIADAILKTG